MTPSNAAALGMIQTLAMAVASMPQYGYMTARRVMLPDTEKTDKRRDKAARNKRKQQKASRKKNR